jgi:hypothetical protein
VIEDDGGQVVARIQIERKLMIDGSDRIDAQFDEGSEESGTPAAVELLGMLTMAIDTVLHGGIYDEDGEE